MSAGRTGSKANSVKKVKKSSTTPTENGKPETSSRVQALQRSELVQKVQAKYGAAILRSASASPDSALYLPTGSFRLNQALGGGWRVGRIHTVYGKKSSGKTALCLNSVAEMQKRCADCLLRAERCTCKHYREPVCVYIDVEGTWEDDWARALSVNTDSLLLSQPDHQEQTLDIAEGLLRSTEVDLLVLDSIAFMTPAKEIEESTGKALQAEQARVLGRGIRKFVSAINYCGNIRGRRPTIMCTNQVRAVIGGQAFGPKEISPGGFAPGFASTSEVKCWAGAYEMDKETGKPIYAELNYKVEKNKASGAKMQGNWFLLVNDFGKKKKGEFYEELALVETGVALGLVQKNGTAWRCMDEGYRSKALLVDKLIENVEFRETYETQLQALL